MTNWRPLDWEEIKRRTIAETLQRDMCEAIADAILEALKKEGSLMTPEQMRLIAPDRQYPRGYLVFIEEMK